MRIVLDTNALLSSLARKSPYRPIFDALINSKYELAVSSEILLEYEEIVSERTTPEIGRNVSELLINLPNLIKQEVWYFWNVIHKDPDDNKFVDCYVACTADYLVTNDKHYNVLKDIKLPFVKVITIQAFLEIIKALPESE